MSGRIYNFDFGDERLNKRGNEFIKNMQERESIILHKIATNWKEEIAYGRFLENPKVTREHLIKESTKGVEGSVQDKHVLILEDSSELNYTIKQHKIKGLGLIGRGKESGFEIHPNLVVDAADGTIYGISDIFTWKRSEAKLNSTLRAKKPYWEKESGRWILSAKKSIVKCSGASMRTVIADREADMFDLFNTLPNPQLNNHILVRSCTDRVLYGASIKLFEYTDLLPIKGIYSIDLPKTPNRSAHTAKLELRYDKVKIQRCSTHWDKTASEFIELYVVDVREQPESMKGNEEPIHWRLFTTHHVESFAIARLIIDWYCMRWWIEQLFRTLKNRGFRIEDSQVEQYDRLVKLVIIGIITSVRVLQLTKARDGRANQKLEAIFSKPEIVVLTALCKKYEGDTQKLKNPYPQDSLAYGSWVIARLGGWKGYVSQRPAGPITMYEGLKKFCNIFEGWQLMNEIK